MKNDFHLLGETKVDEETTHRAVIKQAEEREEESSPVLSVPSDQAVQV